MHSPPHNIISTPAYYQWRNDDFVARNPKKTAPPYYVNYGLLYSQRFENETKSKLSAHGQKWTDEVMLNLQTLMENRLSQADGAEFEQNAQALKSFAFASHVEAYWNENGTSPLYTLKFSDLFSIVLTPNFRDLISADGLIQIITITGKLIGFWSRKLLKIRQI
jgi:hypothetical protein